MTYADDPDDDPQEVDDDAPALGRWPSLPIFRVTLGTIFGWFRARRQ